MVLSASHIFDLFDLCTYHVYDHFADEETEEGHTLSKAV